MSETKGRGYSIKVEAKEATVPIYEEIGEGGWFEGFSAKQFAEELKAWGKLEKIIVRINSPGGEVFDGITIYNLLKQNSAKVIVYVDGLAASIASVIAMAGDEIHMADNALMMIHDPWSFAIGNAADMRETADRLDKVAGTIVRTYAKKTGKGEQELADMMAAETWMNADEAVEHGFADYVVEALPMAASANFDLEKFRYKRSPLAAGTPMRPAAEVKDPGTPMRPNLEFLDAAMQKISDVLERTKLKAA